MIATKFVRVGRTLKLLLTVLLCVSMVLLLCVAYKTVANHVKINENGLYTAFFYDIPFLSDGLNDNSTYVHPRRQHYSEKFYTINFFKRHFYKELLTDADSINKSKGNYPGKYGKGVNIDHGVDKPGDPFWTEFHKYEFNVMASDKIPINREAPKKLMSSCYNMKYPIDLPKASVIIVFHNEANSTLFRTIHSVYTRSPLYLIEEIILVDDASDLEKYPHLNENLVDKIKFYPNIKLIRQPKRIGLTNAKIIGSKSAKGDVLVFLDSHCECYDGWLEPLLYSIRMNPRIAVTPVIDIIYYNDFSITNNIIDYANIGVFNFKLDFQWKGAQMPHNMLLKSPTMAGGLFAIDRKFFFQAGAYDDGMGFWGGENIEMSFRLWTCADGIYIHHCSIVGHVFRDTSPHELPPNSVLINKIRVTEVWLDEFKPLFYDHYSTAKTLNHGNITSRIELRKKLNCKSFRWYLDNIATMVKIGDTSPYASGSLSNVKHNPTDKQFCMDTYGNAGSLKFIKCHHNGGNQNFIFNHDREIRSGELCLDTMSNVNKDVVHTVDCHGNKGNQEWFHKKNGLISASKNFDRNCLELDESDSQQNSIRLAPCDVYSINQLWFFSSYGSHIPG